MRPRHGAGAGAWQRGSGEHGRDMAARGSNMAATWQREGGIMAAAWQRHGRERAGTRHRHGSEPADGDGYGEGRDGGEGDRAGPQPSCVQHARLRTLSRRRDTPADIDDSRPATTALGNHGAGGVSLLGRRGDAPAAVRRLRLGHRLLLRPLQGGGPLAGREVGGRPDDPAVQPL